MIEYLKRKFQEWKKEREYKRKIKELRKRDPFNYKNF
jgi:hypothetical protein